MSLPLGEIVTMCSVNCGKWKVESFLDAACCEGKDLRRLHEVTGEEEHSPFTRSGGEEQLNLSLFFSSALFDSRPQFSHL